MTALSAPTSNTAATTRTRSVTWTDPSQIRERLAGRDGYERMLAIQRDSSSAPPAAALLGMELDTVERGRVRFSIVADEVHENPMGTMHGGVIATLVDSAMGCAVATMLSANEQFTTLELSTNFVRPVTSDTGRVFADGRVVHRGGRVATTEARVYDNAGTMYAHATSTCMILRSPRATGAGTIEGDNS